jgi:hypothetical protein
VETVFEEFECSAQVALPAVGIACEEKVEASGLGLGEFETRRSPGPCYWSAEPPARARSFPRITGFVRPSCFG